MAYAVEGKLLFASDTMGPNRWHVASRKKVGPYLVGGSGGYLLGVNPLGDGVCTMSEDRRLQFWSVPKPIAGMPYHVGRIVRIHTGSMLADGDGLRPSTERTESSDSPESVFPPLPVTDFRELHGAELPAVKTWMAALTKNLRPTHLTVQEGSNGKRFDALAIDDGSDALFEAHLALGPKEGEKYGQDADDPAMWGQGWQRSWCAFYYDGPRLYRHQLWTKGR